MDNASLVVVAMAERCRRVVQAWDKSDSRLPKKLRQEHLLWMCDKIEKLAEVGPANKLYRWIGFVQGAMLANRMLVLDELKAMSDKAKRVHGDASNDLEDLCDHPDPTNPSEFDIGGQG